ncbi:hypothetical protein XANCAGTX0491_001266 [Xanthoria calcicola]
MTGSIDDLSNEIILQIFQELATPGWPIETLVNSTLVYRRFHDLALPPLSRKLTISLGTGLLRWTKRLFEYLQSPSGEHIVHCVEQIDITAGSRSFCADDLFLEFMAMLPQFLKLRTIRIMPYSIISHLTPLSGRYEGVRYVPSALLAAISDLYPRVDIDLELCGLVHDCRRILKDCPNIRAFDFTGIPGDYIPGTREVASVEKQLSFTKLSVRLQSLRSFFPPQSDAGFQAMCLEELYLDNHDHPDRPSPNKGLSLCHFVDLDTLRVLRLQGHNLIVSVLDELSNSSHKLESVSIDGGKRPPSRSPYYDLILRFFTSARLREITIQNLGPRVPWLDCISNSGSGLLQLAIHATDRYWRQVTPQSVAESGFGTTLKLDVTQKELWRLVTICPSIQRLGIDLPRVELAVELLGYIESG